VPRVDLDLEIAVRPTARVKQVQGMFDVPEAKKQAVSFHFDVPVENRPWKVGLITGPSGAGKSSVARHLFGPHMVDGYDWPKDRAVVDGFGDMPIAEVVGALSSVGFGSPPGWLKPFRVLSNGEKFRATLARAIVDPRPLVVLDEFSSVVDRQVARIGSHATAKAVRAREGKQFVAVTCHDDVVDWLQPDWVLEPHAGLFAWRSLQRRPRVEVEVVRCTLEAWRWFAPHHYLTGKINRSARCWVGLVGGKPAAFTSILPFPHKFVQHARRVHRAVVLPDYQGLGLGLRINEVVGSVCRALGMRLMITTSHPALIASFARSTSWRMNRAPSVNRSHQGEVSSSRHTHRRTAGFEYVGPAMADERAARRMYA
jgi:hypothetical protein